WKELASPPTTPSSAAWSACSAPPSPSSVEGALAIRHRTSMFAAVPGALRLVTVRRSDRTASREGRQDRQGGQDRQGREMGGRGMRCVEPIFSWERGDVRPCNEKER